MRVGIIKSIWKISLVLLVIAFIIAVFFAGHVSHKEITSQRQCCLEPEIRLKIVDNKVDTLYIYSNSKRK